MSDNQIITLNPTNNLVVPVARIPINIREATLADLSFIDSLQKKHTKMVGWMPTMQLEGKIKAKQVLIAESRTEDSGLRTERNAEERTDCINLSPQSSALSPVGYCIAQDQYFKRDDVGIIYQMNVEPGKQRGLVGAMLLKAQFERSAYGCKLYCCWCAQDIAANHFWESMGFVALAFRTGSRGKSRVHIFWQKRIRSGDETTPYWFPSQTTSGSIREDRIVLPIPPGTSWQDAKPLVLPGGSGAEMKMLGDEKENKPRRPRTPKPESGKHRCTPPGGMRFGAPPKEGAVEEKVKKEKPEKQPRAKVKNDPKLVAAARELRDRWLEKANEDPSAFLANGKYDVSRMIAQQAPSDQELLALPCLDVAIAA